ncbi:MAG TPA: hypothetical protein VNE62_05000 [Actinomycetota bacterium]|nr:hypothetical protein [Actinomycetota bacterium]
MGILNVLFGRRRLPPSTNERLGAISGAELTVRTQLSHVPADQVALAVRGVAASSFDEVKRDLERLLAMAADDLGSTSRITTDEYGFVWVVVQDQDFPDLVAAAQIASQMVLEQGFRDQLLCCVFPFLDDQQKPLHLVYSFKRGTFYAFAPRSGSARDSALELRAHALLEGELPMEKDLEYRYPLWGLPFTGAAS